MRFQPSTRPSLLPSLGLPFPSFISEADMPDVPSYRTVQFYLAIVIFGDLFQYGRKAGSY